jgi:hypothetical protein
LSLWSGDDAAFCVQCVIVDESALKADGDAGAPVVRTTEGPSGTVLVLQSKGCVFYFQELPMPVDELVETITLVDASHPALGQDDSRDAAVVDRTDASSSSVASRRGRSQRGSPCYVCGSGSCCGLRS